MSDRHICKAKRTDNGEWVEGNLVLSEDAEDGWDAIIIPSSDGNMFTKGGYRQDLPYWTDKIEVVGNIFDNPELLEGGAE